MDPGIHFFESVRNGRHNKSVKGFTLIELMVVVAIIGIISAFLVPMILGLRDKETPKENSVPKAVRTTVSEKKQDFETKTAEKIRSIVPITESAEVTVKLVAKNYLHRLKVYTLFDATFRGRFTFKNPSDDLDRIRLEFPFPEGTTQARDVSLKFLDVSGQFVEPDGVAYDLKGMWWVGSLPKDKQIEAQVTYGAQGYDRFVYEGPGAGRSGSFKLTMALEGVTTEFIPAETLQPTTVKPGHLEWDYRNLVTDRKVIVELPGAMSPIGRIILLSELAGLAIFLFGLGFLYLSELKQPGRLDNFRWGDFLLLALNYFLFFIIFMVFSLGGEMGTWTAMGLAGVLSLPLLVVHVWRVLDGTFALTRVLPLTVFTLAIVINGVYGGEYRKFIFIGFAVAVIALLTFTYKKLMEGRREHREAKIRRSEAQKSREMEINKKEKAQRKRVDKQRSMEGKLKKPFAETATQLKRLEALAEEANMLIEYGKIGQKTEKDPSLEKMLAAVAEIRQQHDDGFSKADALLKTTEGEDVSALGADIEQENFKHRQRIGMLHRTLSEYLEALKQSNEKAKARAGSEKQGHCIACGAKSPSYPYCPQCGVLSPLELKCRRCGEVYKLPLHLIREKKARDPIHCMLCGQAYNVPALREKKQSKEDPAV